MSLDMFGEWILILLESKSGNIERLLLRFWVEERCGKFCDGVYSAAQKKEVIYLLWLVSNGSRDQGWPRSDRGLSAIKPLTPAKGFFHITLCCGELGSVVGL